MFQGRGRRRHYFEGWYFKLIDKARQNVLAVIPGISMGTSRQDSHAFIQRIDAVRATTAYYRFPFDSFYSDPKRFFVRIDDNIFSDTRLRIDLGSDELRADIHFENVVKFPKTFFSPGIMGPFSFVPGMECYHGIVNMSHTIRGKMTVSGQNIDMDGGEGYIEKDWGRSFPDSWIWLQANHFEESGVSFMFSVARIPWLGRSFTGLISFLMTPTGFYRFATYNGSHITHISLNGNMLRVRMQNPKNTIEFSARYAKGGILRAPKNGLMQRDIEESITAQVELALFAGNEVIYKGTSDRAGMEIAGNMGDILPV